MFNWFRGKEEETVTPFPDSESAFHHACSIGYPLLLEARIPALVLEEGKRGAEGEHWFLLRLASRDGDLDIWAPTLSGAPAYPEMGNLVAFRIVRFATELPHHARLVGYIDCRLKPELNDMRGWRIATSFRPDHMKPELHLG